MSKHPEDFYPKYIQYVFPNKREYDLFQLRNQRRLSELAQITDGTPGTNTIIYPEHKSSDMIATLFVLGENREPLGFIDIHRLKNESSEIFMIGSTTVFVERTHRNSKIGQGLVIAGHELFEFLHITRQNYQPKPSYLVETLSIPHGDEYIFQRNGITNLLESQGFVRPVASADDFFVKKYE